MSQTRLVHAFTVDVEEHFQVLNFQRRLPRSEWSRQPSRVAGSTRRILDLLDERDVKGTFFVLGCVAAADPALVKEIAGRGHEVGSHGYSHTPLTALTEAEFAEEAASSKKLLEDIAGVEVLGFRAPSFSILDSTRWGLDVLLRAGYAYDSSVFPVRHPDYGIPGAEDRIHRMATPGGAEIVEFPMTAVRWMGRRLPVAGGGYFRLLPYPVTRFGWRRVERSGRPGVFYMHPWEVDPEQPDLRSYASPFGAFRHYTGLKRTLPRLRRLLGEFRFAPMARVIETAGFPLCGAPAG